jgi:lysozyme family protein
MPDPINYLSMIQPVNIAESLGQGLQVGEALHDRFKVRPDAEAYQKAAHTLAITAAADKIRQQQQYQQDVSNVIKNPTPEGYRGLLVAYPEQHEALKAAWDGYSEDEKDRNLKAATGVYGALANNKPDLALDLLRNRKQALADAGEDTTETDHLISLLESGDPEQVKAAKGIAGFVIAGAVGPDKVGSTLEALGGSIGERKGQVVGRAIGHYDENGKWVLDYRDPEEFTLSKGQARFSGDGGGSAPSSGAVQDGKLDPHQFFADFVAPHEGGFNPSDANGSPTNFGINQAAHPEVDVKTLTKDQAADIFAKDYFQASGADKLPPALAAVHADTSYINPAMAKRFLTASGGDPQKYMDMRETWMKSMVAREPQKFGKYDKAWTNRNADLRQFAQQVGSGAGGGPRQIASVPDSTAADVDIPGNTSLGGEAYLQTVPKNLATQVRALSEGRLPLPSSFAMSKPYWQRLLQMTAQYDPTFDAANAKTRAKTRAEFTSGKSAANITSFNTVMGHLDSLDKSIDALGNTRFPWWNKVANAAAYASGDTHYQKAFKNFQASKNAVSRELTRAYRGSGGNVSDIKDFESELDAADSPEALHETIRKYVDLLSSRINALGEQYNAGMGRSSDPINLLDPHARAVFKRLVGEGDSGGGTGAPPGGKRIGSYQGKPVYLLPNGKRVVAQ